MPANPRTELAGVIASAGKIVTFAVAVVSPAAWALRVIGLARVALK